MKKICALVLLLGSLAVVPGCMEKCEGETRHYFDVRGFTASNILREDFTINNATDFSVLSDTALSVQAELYGISLFGRVHYYAQNEVAESAFGAAYACSPGEPGSKGSSEVISEITVLSDTDFDTNHPAGTNLNEFFRISAFRTFSLPIDSLQGAAIQLTEFISRNSRARQSFELWLTQRPETALSHRFTVVYRQTNGEEYVVNTPLVTFQ